MLPVPSNPNQDPRALIDAIENGNLADVQKLLPSADHLKNFQTKDKKTGDSLIHFAVRGGNNKILEFLLKEIGLDSNLANKNKDYPLNLVAKKSKNEDDPRHLAANSAIKTLLAAGATLLPDQFGNTPLHTVIEYNNIDGYYRLVEAGADINVLNSGGQSPLKVAEITKLRYNDPTIFDSLKSKNAEYDGYTTKGLGTRSAAKSSMRSAASHEAVSSEYFNTNAVSVKNLLDLAGGEVSDGYFPDVEKRINNILSSEVNDKIEAVKKDKNKSDEDKKNEIENLRRSCIRLKKEMELRNEKGETPLIVASLNGSARIVEAFLIAGADVHARSKENRREGNQTAIIAAARGEDNPATVNILIEHGANVNDTDATPGVQPGDDLAEGWPVATICVMNSLKKHSIESPKVLGALLENGLNPDSTDKDAVTNLIAGCYYGSINSIKALLEAGAKVDLSTAKTYIDFPGYTALHAAAERGNNDIIKLLLEKNADLEKKNGKEETPLEVAYRNKEIKTVKLLYENGAIIPESSAEEIIKDLVFLETKIKTLKLLYENGAKIRESSVEKIIKDLVSLKTKEEKIKSLRDGIKLIGAKIPESSVEKIFKGLVFLETDFKGLVFLETEEEKSKSLQVRIGSIDKKRDERLSGERIESIINGEELEPNNTFTNDKKFIAITSDTIKSAAEKPDCKINPVYRKLIELNKIGVENGDTDNSDKVIKAALEHPEEFKALFETASKINKVDFKDDNNPIVKADSDQEKNKILHDLKLVLDPSSNLKLNKQSFYDGVEKLGNTLSAKFMKALGGKDNAKKLIDNFLDEKPSPSSSPREGKVKASQLMKISSNWVHF